MAQFEFHAPATAVDMFCAAICQPVPTGQTWSQRPFFRRVLHFVSAASADSGIDAGGPNSTGLRAGRRGYLAEGRLAAAAPWAAVGAEAGADRSTTRADSSLLSAAGWPFGRVSCPAEPFAAAACYRDAGALYCTVFGWSTALHAL